MSTLRLWRQGKLTELRGFFFIWQCKWKFFC